MKLGFNLDYAYHMLAEFGVLTENTSAFSTCLDYLKYIEQDMIDSETKNQLQEALDYYNIKNYKMFGIMIGRIVANHCQN